MRHPNIINTGCAGVHPLAPKHNIAELKAQSGQMLDYKLDLRHHLYSSWTKSGQLRPLLLLANPAVLKATRYCPLPCRFIPESEPFTAEDPSTLGESLLPLLTLVNRVEHIAHSDLAKLDFQRAVEFISDLEARRRAEGKKHCPRHTVIFHALLKLHLLDQLRWALHPYGSIPIQTLDLAETSARAEDASEGTEDPRILPELYGAGVRDWLETARTMVARFLTDTPPLTEASLPTNSSTDSVVYSLLREIKKSKSDRHASTVTLNICAAALALRSLLMVCSNDRHRVEEK